MQEMCVWFLGWEDPLEKEMVIHSNILPGKSHWRSSLVGYSPWGRKESDTTEWLNNKTYIALSTRAGLTVTQLETNIQRIPGTQFPALALVEEPRSMVIGFKIYNGILSFASIKHFCHLLGEEYKQCGSSHIYKNLSWKKGYTGEKNQETLTD